MKKIRIMGLILVLLFGFGCAANRHALTGAAVGGAAGLAICGEKCAWVGGALGTALGNEWDEAEARSEWKEERVKREESKKTEVIALPDGKTLVTVKGSPATVYRYSNGRYDGAGNNYREIDCESAPTLRAKTSCLGGKERAQREYERAQERLWYNRGYGR